MDLLEAIRERHTVRTYDGRAIEGEALAELQRLIDEYNKEGNIHFQLVNGQENALAPFKIRYGKWTDVTNYIGIIGQDAADLEERCGYYGEKIVLWAQTAGLRTGWVETTYTTKPEALSITGSERLVLSLCIGYSDMTGSAHRVKGVDVLSDVKGEAPEWFMRGMEYAALSPTAGNQQLFCVVWDGENLSMTTKKGLLEGVDMGIAKYHFELGAGISHSMWK